MQWWVVLASGRYENKFAHPSAMAARGYFDMHQVFAHALSPTKRRCFTLVVPWSMTIW